MSQQKTFGTNLLAKQAEIEEYGQAGNEAIGRLADYIKKRTALSEEYAKGLQKLNRQFAPIQKADLGLADLLAATENIVGAHMSYVEEVQGTLLDGIRNTAREHDKLRRDAMVEVRTLSANWKKTMITFDKIRKAKDAAVKEAENARMAFEKANNDRNVTKAFVEKMRDEYSLKARRTLVTKEEYIQAARVIKQEQRQFYHTELAGAFDKLQRVEELRIKKIRLHLKEFGHQLYSAVDEEVKSYNSMRNKWDAIDHVGMLEAFIREVDDQVSFEFPENIQLDECAATESLGLASPKSFTSATTSSLMSPTDPSSIKKRLEDLEKQIVSLGKQHEGIRVLYELYESQPELADSKTKADAGKEFIDLSTRLSYLYLERDQLERKLTLNNSESNLIIMMDETNLSKLSTPSSPVLWEEPSPSITAPEPSPLPGAPNSCLSAIEMSSLGSTIKPVKARVLYDFDATNPDHELSVKTGQELQVISKSDDEWLHAEIDGRTGFVPLNFVQLDY